MLPGDPASDAIPVVADFASQLPELGDALVELGQPVFEGGVEAPEHVVCGAPDGIHGIELLDGAAALDATPRLERESVR